MLSPLVRALIPTTSADYEQQRLHLLHKYGIDLEFSHGNGGTDGARTRRLDRKEVERLMGGGNGQEGIFTWREKNRRKVRQTPPHPHSPCLILRDTMRPTARVLCVSEGGLMLARSFP